MGDLVQFPSPVSQTNVVYLYGGGGRNSDLCFSWKTFSVLMSAASLCISTLVLLILITPQIKEDGIENQVTSLNQTNSLAPLNILIAGGFTSSLPTSETELLYPQAPRYELPNLPVPLTDGFMFSNEGSCAVVCGGRLGSGLVSKACWALQGETKTVLEWKPLDINMREWRSNAGVVKNPDGTVWVTGGLDGQGYGLRSSELLSPSHSSTLPGPKLPYPVVDHCIVVLPDGNSLLIGGNAFIEDSWQDSNQVFLFTDTLSEWQPWPNMTLGRNKHACAVLGSDHVVVAGGFDAAEGQTELLDLQTLQWREVARLPHSLKGAVGLTWPGKGVLVMGGWDYSTNGSGEQNSVLSFNLESGWTRLNTTMRLERHNFMALPVRDLAGCVQGES